MGMGLSTVREGEDKDTKISWDLRLRQKRERHCRDQLTKW